MFHNGQPPSRGNGGPPPQRGNNAPTRGGPPPPIRGGPPPLPRGGPPTGQRGVTVPTPPPPLTTVTHNPTTGLPQGGRGGSVTLPNTPRPGPNQRQSYTGGSTPLVGTPVAPQTRVGGGLGQRPPSGSGGVTGQQQLPQQQFRPQQFGQQRGGGPPSRSGPPPSGRGFPPRQPQLDPRGRTSTTQSGGRPTQTTPTQTRPQQVGRGTTQQNFGQQRQQSGGSPSGNRPPTNNNTPPTIQVNPNLLALEVSDGHIPGFTILRWLHEITQAQIARVQRHLPQLQPNSNVYNVRGGSDWMRTGGRMAIMISGIDVRREEKMLGSNVRASHNGPPLRLEQSRETGERLYFSGSDPTYQRILELRRMLPNLSDKDVAAAILHKARLGAHYQFMTREATEFIDGMTALLFGVESSRNNDSFATSVMILERILGGSITFEQAFYENGRGGRYPMASIGTGGGNMRERREFITSRQDDTSARTVLNNQKRHAVPLKEIRLIIAWLRDMHGGPFTNVTKRQAETIIKRYFIILMHEYYETPEVTHASARRQEQTPPRSALPTPPLKRKHRSCSPSPPPNRSPSPPRGPVPQLPPRPPSPRQSGAQQSGAQQSGGGSGPPPPPKRQRGNSPPRPPVPTFNLNVSDNFLMEVGLRMSEIEAASNDGLTTRYRIGHATGNNNACLLASLITHAKGREPSAEEVENFRLKLVEGHVIEDGAEINIYSAAGKNVIRAVERAYGVSLAVAVVNNGVSAPVPVTWLGREALIYLGPGHFVPVWRL